MSRQSLEEVPTEEKTMNKSNKLSPDALERAVKMVQEPRRSIHHREQQSRLSRRRLTVCRTLLDWARRVEVDIGLREGITTAESASGHPMIRLRHSVVSPPPSSPENGLHFNQASA